MTDRIRILCYNIHGGYALDGKRDLVRIREFMDEENIAVGVFQELETRASRGGAEEDIAALSGPDRPHHIHGPNLHDDETGWYGNILISRYPIQRARAHALDTSDRSEPRGAVDGTLDTPLGPLRLIGTHLSLNPLERPREVRNLCRLMQDVDEHEKAPVILMGDFNEWRRSSRLTEKLDTLMFPLPCRASFPSPLPFLRLDRVWADTPGLEVTARTLTGHKTRFLSDHLPILIEAKTAGGAPA